MTAERDLKRDMFQGLHWPESLEEYIEYLKYFLRCCPSQTRVRAKGQRIGKMRRLGFV